MANEILKDDLLTDEQLEQIAGGTIEESLMDAFAMLTAGESLGDGSRYNSNDAIHHSGLRRAWAKYGVSTVLYDDKNIPNEYYMNGKQISRNEALTHLLTVSGHTDAIKNLVR